MHSPMLIHSVCRTVVLFVYLLVLMIVAITFIGVAGCLIIIFVGIGCLRRYQ